jgi:hypothetical protein
MATFQSRYAELTFFVKDKPHKFKNGHFTTEDKEVIEVLEKLSDVTRVDEAKVEKTEEKPKAKRKPTSEK